VIDGKWDYEARVRPPKREELIFGEVQTDKPQKGKR